MSLSPTETAKLATQKKEEMKQERREKTEAEYGRTPLASPTLRDTNRAATRNILANFKPDIEVLLILFDCLVNRKRMLNELGPFALLMHHFTENVNEFRKLTMLKEEFEGFKDVVSSTITQAICG